MGESQQKVNVEVDANKIITRLRDRVSETQHQLDIITLAYEEKVDEVNFLSRRVRELEEGRDAPQEGRVIEHGHA